MIIIHMYRKLKWNIWNKMEYQWLIIIIKIIINKLIKDINKLIKDNINQIKKKILKLLKVY